MNAALLERPQLRLSNTMSFANGVLDSSPVALPEITQPKSTRITLDEVASRTVPGRKRKADASVSADGTGGRMGGKRAKYIGDKGGRENEGREHPSQVSLQSKMRKKLKRIDGVSEQEPSNESNIERFIQLSRSMGIDTAQHAEQLQAPLTPPASYRTIQPPASVTRGRAVSEPASPSSALTSPSSKSSCSTVADELGLIDLTNPFIETPAGMTRPALLRQPSPDTPLDQESETFTESLLQKVKSKNMTHEIPSGPGEKRELPPLELDSNGEKNYLTYVFKGKRIAVPNPLFNASPDPREGLDVRHFEYEASIRLKPQNLFPKAIYGKEVIRNPRSSSSTLEDSAEDDDPFLAPSTSKKRSRAGPVR